MNSADGHSLQFTINKIVYKIFGAMSEDLYIEISAHFGIESVENLVIIVEIALLTDIAKQTISIICVKCCTDWFVFFLSVFLFIAFV